MRSRRPPRLSTFLVLALVGAGVVLPASPAQAASAYQVSAKVDRASIDYGGSLRISGRVTKGPVKHRSVTVYWTRAAQRDSWHKIGRVALSSKGAFAKRYKPRSGGDIRFRVVKSKVGRHAAGRAVTSTSAVYQWQSLWKHWDNGAGVTPGANGATASRGSATVKGTTYAGALRVNDTSAASFSTQGCTALRGRVGLTDPSPAAQGALTFGGTSEIAYLLVMHGHSPVSVGVDLDPSSPLQISADIPGGQTGGTADTMALVAPQVRCNAPA